MGSQTDSSPKTSAKPLSPQGQNLIDTFNFNNLVEAQKRGEQLDQAQMQVFQTLSQRLGLPIPGQ